MNKSHLWLLLVVLMGCTPALADLHFLRGEPLQYTMPGGVSA